MGRSPSSLLAATVAYADIFDYPLALSEVRQWGIGIQHKKHVALPAGVEKAGEYLVLKKRTSLIVKRKKRFHASISKWHVARRVGMWLRLIPTIQLVGVTGGLAMNNADKEDDIDFFIITSDRTVWISRFLCFCMVTLLGRRRKPKDTKVKDKVCLNMFMSESAMTMPRSQRDLFTAHEVLQMQPLWWRGKTYGVFLQKNQWVRFFLPVAWRQKKLSFPVSMVQKSPSWVIRSYQWCEWPVRTLQRWYMKRHQTTETVTDSVLQFHPKDARVWVKQALQTRLDRLHIPLDKIFYRS